MLPLKAVIPACALALALTPAAGASVHASSASKKPKEATTGQLSKSPDLWATVNVCDTTAHPDGLGIRASMPGDNTKLALYMRFQAQYLAATDGKWHNIAEGADSGFTRIGRASTGVRESGWSFTFLPPAGGGAHMLRGAVTFEWRNKHKVVHRLKELTEAGHKSKAGADPANFSAATCEIR